MGTEKNESFVKQLEKIQNPMDIKIIITISLLKTL
jgi:hypothetical protein